MGLAKRKLDRVVLIAAANLPDVDALAAFWGEDAERSFRRGWTHGVLAMVVLPLLLGSIAWLFDRDRRIYGLACLGVWSHPLLDWLNTYGIRLLMPFDGTWFYGDALFIVDPYLWLMLGAAVMLARSKSLAGIAGWLALGIAATALVLLAERSPLGVKIVWSACLLMLALARWRRWGEGRFQR